MNGWRTVGGAAMNKPGGLFRGPTWRPALVVVGLAMLVVAGLAWVRKPAAKPITVGDVAPDFTLPAVGGGSVSLKDYRGQKPVLLYFSMGPG